MAIQRTSLIIVVSLLTLIRAPSSLAHQVRSTEPAGVAMPNYHSRGQDPGPQSDRQTNHVSNFLKQTLSTVGKMFSSFFSGRETLDQSQRDSIENLLYREVPHLNLIAIHMPNE